MKDPGAAKGPALSAKLTGMPRDQSSPNMEPRDAATLILIDRSGTVPKVLMGKRHHGHKFMPGKFVFPGGRIEAVDYAMPAAGELHADAEAKLLAHVANATPTMPRAFALAAIRETYEETGLLLGEKRDDAPASPGDIWDAFAQSKVYPDLSDIHFIARAITPPGRPRRFDTRFFTTDASSIAHRIDGVVGPDAELVELVWVPIRDAIHLDLPMITEVALEELEARIGAGMAHDLAVPFYRMDDTGYFGREVL